MTLDTRRNQAGDRIHDLSGTPWVKQPDGTWETDGPRTQIRMNRAVRFFVVIAGLSLVSLALFEFRHFLGF